MKRYPTKSVNKSRTKISRGFVVVTLILGAVAAAAAIVWSNRDLPRDATGTPQLMVDREIIDLGNIVYRTPVRAVFKLTNTGDGVLQIGAARIDVLKGC